MQMLNIPQHLSLVWLVFIILAIPYVSANLGTFKQHDCISIRILANCSSVDIVEVTSPNATYIINETMDNIGGQTFLYSFCNTSAIGEYSYSWDNPCADCSQNNCGNSFLITVTGQELTTAKAFSYILIFIVSVLIFVGLLFLGIALPSKNKSDEMTGYVIAVNNLKHLKILCLAVAYLVFLFIAYFSWMVCYAYLDMDFVAEMFRILFYGLSIMVIPLFILFTYIMIANMVRDSKISDLLSRGLKVNG